MAAGDTLLSVERLTKRYGSVTALNDVSFAITDGITGILGENGAGKSTVIKILLGLVPPSSGRATILGQDASSDVMARARIGYMPEHDCLPSQVSAAEFLTHMAEVSGLPPGVARTRAADTLRHTGLFEERYRAIGGYSTGMKQRVKLAQALVHDPAFVFLDEPTAGLDPAGREEMLTLIRKTHREFGISVLFSSHLMADVERTCDRIIVMQGGHLVHAGEVDQFTSDTETVFIEVDANRDGQVSRDEMIAARQSILYDAAYGWGRPMEVLQCEVTAAFLRDFMADAPDEVGLMANLRLAPALPLFPEHLHGRPIIGLVATYAGPVEESQPVPRLSAREALGEHRAQHVAVAHPGAVVGEALDADERQHVAVRVAIVGEQGRRIDDDRPVLENGEPVVDGFWRVIGWEHADVIGQRRARAVFVDHVERDRRHAFGVWRERDRRADAAHVVFG